MLGRVRLSQMRFAHTRVRVRVHARDVMMMAAR